MDLTQALVVRPSVQTLSDVEAAAWQLPERLRDPIGDCVDNQTWDSTSP